MDFMTALDIGASGLSAERTHLNVISMNLANVNTTRTPEGGPYRRKSVVFQSTPLDSPFTKAMRSELEREVQGVKVSGVVTDQRPLKRVYDPGHPDADGQGYVSLPDINVVEEMANMMTALRTYEANAATVSSAKAMFNKALELGR
ncbi:flagellar basal-body rod protein FlgC [Desulfonatronum thiosulfatophilum]|uniref:Flagellar basal-body rod protein FlgC n=1 Tax=Desulfonatronum thiosulfatophilum TaxID=617002 RepID=A0A1G6AVB5_9BACT|nr:flagellar basal body rod protein FlgC [Desulfonatronum thiosulfatophilum]SDB12239.1 flagellar basal-body rod protein FlgC [Desulfonatronum thiosulfatophilum]